MGLRNLLNSLIDLKKSYNCAIRNSTHSHKIYKNEITSETKTWKCRGPIFYNNQQECDNNSLKKIKFKYSCICLKCIENGGIDYCNTCTFKESAKAGFFTHIKHDCG